MLERLTPRPRTVLVIGAVAILALLSACSTSDQAGTTAGTASSAVAPGTTAGGGGGTSEATGAPVPSPGCGNSTVKAMDKQRQDVAAGGPDRWFLLTVPPNHDGKTPLPLVFDFHGLMEGAQVHSAMTGFSDLANREGFVVAFPNGTGNPVHWNANLDPSNPDLAYFDAMLDQLGRQLCIDTSRVYSTGLSYGAIMTSTLACVRTEKLAAVAPVDGVQMMDGCHPDAKIPMQAMHGTADPLLSFNGGLGSAVSGLLQGQLTENNPGTTVPYDLNGEGYPKTVAAWAALNGCDPKPTDTNVTANVVRRVYTCPPDGVVEFWIALGGGHAWPGSEFSKSIEKVVGPTTFDYNATETIWEFFKRFQRT